MFGIFHGNPGDGAAACAGAPQRRRDLGHEPVGGACLQRIEPLADKIAEQAQQRHSEEAVRQPKQRLQLATRSSDRHASGLVSV